MPITLACPSCSKRFRARDESAGKRVKCPFCQAAVAVPDADAPSGGDAPPAPPPFVPPAPARPAAPPPPPEPALFDVVGRPATGPAAPPRDLPPLPPPSRPEPLFGVADPPPRPPGRPPRPEPAAKVRPAAAPRPERTPEQAALGGWRKVKGGLWWVLFGLFWLALLGVVPFGKLVYERFRGPLPRGDGADWVKYDGVLNTPGESAVQLNQTELLDLGLFGVPILLAGLAIIFGRLTCGAAPRTSGARGVFAFSGLAALLAFAGLVTYAVCDKVRDFPDVREYGRLAAVVGGGLSEFWFLLGLGAAAATLRRPAAVRSVGGYALVLGLALALVWANTTRNDLADLYQRYAGQYLNRPNPADADWQFYEAGAKMLGWLLVVGMYWRAVGGVRRAIRDHLRDASQV